MIYEVRANLFFQTSQIPEEIKQTLVTIWQHAIVVNPGHPDQQCSEFEIIRCYHDEHPPLPCEVIFHKDNCPGQ